MTESSLRECFEKAFRKQGQKKAVTFLRGGKAETEITYQDLQQDANRMANTFRTMGVEKGDRVILFFPKSLVFAVAHVALQKLGAVAVPLNPGFKKSEMAYFIEDAKAKLVLSGSQQETMIKDIAPDMTHLVVPVEKPYQEIEFLKTGSAETPNVEIAPHDPGLIIYTSGTTGKPKGAVLTHGNLVQDAKNIIQIWEISESDVLCHALPLFHVHGLCFALHTALMAGAHVLMLDAFTPDNVISILANKEGEEACTVFMAVPSMYTKLMDYAADKKINFDHMRLWTKGAYDQS